MNDFWEMVIPAVAVSTLFLIVFGFLAFMRYLRYKETVALAERGLLRPESERKSSRKMDGRRYFKIGIVLFFVGVGFFCTLIPIAALVGSEEPIFIGIILGVLPASVGLALLAIDNMQNKGKGYFSNRDEEEADGDESLEDPIPPHKNVS